MDSHCEVESSGWGGCRPPANMIYIIQGEISVLLAAMHRGPRWSNSYTLQDESQETLLRAFTDLKIILVHTHAWEDLDPSTVITPFLNVIRDNHTPGPVTGLALSSVNKLLSYSLIDTRVEGAGAVMEHITDAVTHARFVGTETSSDEAVLLKILQVLRTLLSIPAGVLLSNESVCEIMQSCFRLCFEPRLSELLRRSTETILVDMTQLLFSRLASMHDTDQSSTADKMGALSRKYRHRRGSERRHRLLARLPRFKHKRHQQQQETRVATVSSDVNNPEPINTTSSSAKFSGFNELTTTTAAGMADNVTEVVPAVDDITSVSVVDAALNAPESTQSSGKVVSSTTTSELDSALTETQSAIGEITSDKQATSTVSMTTADIEVSTTVSVAMVDLTMTPTVSIATVEPTPTPTVSITTTELATTQIVSIATAESATTPTVSIATAESATRSNVDVISCVVALTTAEELCPSSVAESVAAAIDDTAVKNAGATRVTSRCELVSPPSSGAVGGDPIVVDDTDGPVQSHVSCTGGNVNRGDHSNAGEVVTAQGSFDLVAEDGTQEDANSQPSVPHIDGESEQSRCDVRDGGVCESRSMAEGSLVSCLSAGGADVASGEAMDDTVHCLSTPSRENPQVSGTVVPYGLPCVREVLNLLASLINPADSHSGHSAVGSLTANSSAVNSANNSEFVVQCGLTLLAVAMETGAAHMARLPSLMCLIKDDVCRNLFALLKSDRLSTFSASLRVCLLVFESLRSDLKFQLEMYLTRLVEIIVSDSSRTAYEHKEMALDALLQLWNIPGLVTELYLNYDCDLYCSNLFEDIVNLLAKNAMSSVSLSSVHVLSLEALMTVIHSIEHQCHSRVLGLRSNSNKNHSINTEEQHRQTSDSTAGSNPGELMSVCALSGYLAGHRQSTSLVQQQKQKQQQQQQEQTLPLPSHEQLMAVKHKKKLLATGTEHFNVKPSKGIQFLQENGLLSSPLQPEQVVHFLKENPRLDKKMIGEYISNRHNLEILDRFVKSFDFAGLRVDESLRSYLETFRLPGEAPVIALLMEHFAKHWHVSNGEPFSSSDSAFTLSYAIIMLNVDQHNHNVKKNAVPMSRDEFKRNLEKVDGGSNFNQQMLDEIYTSIKSDEIVMPAEQTGAVRDYYLWKVLLRRGESSTDSRYICVAAHHHTHHHVHHQPMVVEGGSFDQQLFVLLWRPVAAALSCVFERTAPADTTQLQRLMSGFRKCAMIAGHYSMPSVFDSLLTSLYKFAAISPANTFHNSLQNVELPDTNSGTSVPGTGSGSGTGAYLLGSSGRVQLATRTLYTLVHRYGDCVSERGWRLVVLHLLQLFTCRLLPPALTTAEDFVSSTGVVNLIREPAPLPQTPRNDSGLFSSLYSYIALGIDTQTARSPSAEELECRARAKRLVQSELCPEHLLTESKFLRLESLQQLINVLVSMSGLPSVEDGESAEESAGFFLELLIKVSIENRDRMASQWLTVRDHLRSLILSCASVLSKRESGGGGGAGRQYGRFLFQCAVVGLLRLVIRLIRREELTRQVLQSLRILLLLQRASAVSPRSSPLSAPLATGTGVTCVQSVSSHVTAGVYHLLRTAADCVRERDDWTAVFTLLECYGAGASLPALLETQDVASVPGMLSSRDEDGRDSGMASDRCYSDSELYELHNTGQSRGQPVIASTIAPSVGEAAHCRSLGDLSALASHRPSITSASGGWILVGHNGEIEQLQLLPSPTKTIATRDAAVLAPPADTIYNQYSIVHERHLVFHELSAFLRCGECLAFLVRESALISSVNFAAYVQCLRTYVEASVRAAATASSSAAEAGHEANNSPRHSPRHTDSARRGRTRRGETVSAQTRTASSTAGGYEADADSDTESDLPPGYHQIFLQLLDLMHTLHTRAAAIYSAALDCQPPATDYQMPTAEREDLWQVGWCPLLQGMARLCCDVRRPVRTSAVTYLQRALLVHDLQSLTPAEWEACFHKVLFPLLAQLLEVRGAEAIEETQMRISALLCKVFLQHLTPLLSLPTFTALWLTILDFMDKYLQPCDASDMLHEAIPESLKNMLLVMQTAGLFCTPDGYTQLWAITWDRIDSFLPQLRQELFRDHPPNELKSSSEEAPPTDRCSLPLAPSMREVRPASPLHDEEIIAGSSAMNVILQPPLPSPYLAAESSTDIYSSTCPTSSATTSTLLSSAHLPSTLPFILPSISASNALSNPSSAGGSGSGMDPGIASITSSASPLPLPASGSQSSVATSSPEAPPSTSSVLQTSRSVGSPATSASPVTSLPSCIFSPTSSV